MPLPRISTPVALTASVVALLPPQAAEAHAGEVHIGGAGTGMSVTGLLVVGGVVALMAAFFAYNWVRYRREQQLEAARPAGPGHDGPAAEDDEGTAPGER